MNDTKIDIFPYREEHAMAPIRWEKRGTGLIREKALQQLWKIREGDTERTEWRDVPTVNQESINY